MMTTNATNVAATPGGCKRRRPRSGLALVQSHPGDCGFPAEEPTPFQGALILGPMLILQARTAYPVAM